jgi:hypothetical protein
LNAGCAGWRWLAPTFIWFGLGSDARKIGRMKIRWAAERRRWRLITRKDSRFGAVNYTGGYYGQLLLVPR